MKAGECEYLEITNQAFRRIVASVIRCSEDGSRRRDNNAEFVFQGHRYKLRRPPCAAVVLCCESNQNRRVRLHQTVVAYLKELAKGDDTRRNNTWDRLNPQAARIGHLLNRHKFHFEEVCTMQMDNSRGRRVKSTRLLMKYSIRPKIKVSHRNRTPFPPTALQCVPIFIHSSKVEFPIFSGDRSFGIASLLVCVTLISEYITKFTLLKSRIRSLHSILRLCCVRTRRKLFATVYSITYALTTEKSIFEPLLRHERH